MIFRFDHVTRFYFNVAETTRKPATSTVSVLQIQMAVRFGMC